VEDLALRRPTLDDVFLALTGKRAEEANVSGKIARKPTDCADSGEPAIMPISAKNHENA